MSMVVLEDFHRLNFIKFQGFMIQVLRKQALDSH